MSDKVVQSCQFADRDNGRRVIFPPSMKVLLGQWLGSESSVPISPITKYMRAIQEGQNARHAVFDHHREVRAKCDSEATESGDVAEPNSLVVNDVSDGMKRLSIE